MSVSILASNIGKAYKKYPSRLSRLLEWSDPRSVVRHEQHWVLKHINFTVYAGEALGIVGMNGAGKSTLLKIIAGTTMPTTGHVHLNGRVAALLELGMGFHPEFTGRQNAVRAGQLLGYSTREIEAHMSAIEEFAEIGDYIDQPVRIYSSGMQMRLAFSVATAQRPDILIVDEALSVGDTYFQHKSFERIREFRKQGTTLLIVSHDKNAIQSVCDRALLLSNGDLLQEGEPEAIMDHYNALLADHQNQTVTQRMAANGKAQTQSGSGEATVVDIKLLDEHGSPVELARVGQRLCLRIVARCHTDIQELVCGFKIKDRLGQEVYGTNTYHYKKTAHDLAKGTTLTCEFEFSANLGDGSYSITTSLHTGDTHLHKNYEWCDRALMFNVLNVNKPNFVGITWLDPDVRTCVQEANSDDVATFLKQVPTCQSQTHPPSF